jgi:hypothetical protein
MSAVMGKNILIFSDGTGQAGGVTFTLISTNSFAQPAAAQIQQSIHQNK